MSILKLLKRITSAAAIVLAGCATRPSIPTPPFDTELKLDQSGIVVDYPFDVVEQNTYSFALKFRFPKTSYFERVRVRKVLGGFEGDLSRTAQNPGVPTLVRLVITKLQPESATAEKPVYERAVDPMLIIPGEGFFSKPIGVVNLPAGKYRARLENLKPTLEFRSIPTYFTIGWRAKSSLNSNSAQTELSSPQQEVAAPTPVE